MAVGRVDVLKLYRALLRHSGRFADYNYREYALRRTREGFRAAQQETKPAAIKRGYYDGLNNLAIIKRQAAISQMFAADPVVIEQKSSSL
jgi:LYR motif-containing protein 4